MNELGSKWNVLCKYPSGESITISAASESHANALVISVRKIHPGVRISVRAVEMVQ